MLQLLNSPASLIAPGAELAAQGFTQIPDVLDPALADRLHDCLVREVPWTLACRTAQGSQTYSQTDLSRMSAIDRASLDKAIGKEAKQGFGFAYESYMMVPAYLEQREPGLLLHKLLELLNHQQTLQMLARVTGDHSVTRLDAQATCYRPGHFLRYHNDQADGEGRRFAFVLNLSRQWQADWGGLLQILNGRDQVVATLSPSYNSLSLFRVPLEHCVSMVTPFAQQPRLAITGWLKQ